MDVFMEASFISKAVNGQSVLTRAWTEPAERLSAESTTVNSAQIFNQQMCWCPENYQCVWICIEIYLIADPIKFKRAHSSPFPNTACGRAGNKIWKGSASEARHHHYFMRWQCMQFTDVCFAEHKLDLMTDDSHACKSSLIWSTTALNVSWNVNILYIYMGWDCSRAITKQL